MAATRKSYKYHDEPGRITIVEEWQVSGVPAVARDDAALPQGGEAQAEVAACIVVARDIEYLGGRKGKGNYSWATITYRNEPPLVLDGVAVLIYDMIAGTERRYAEVDPPGYVPGTPKTGLGTDGEGVDVYVPRMEITYRHRASAFPEAVVGALTGNVNVALWKGRAIGTVLFLGARGENSVPGEWMNEYHFAYHPGGLKNVSWLAHKQKAGTDGDAFPFLERTWSTDVQSGQAYETGDFSALPI